MSHKTGEFELISRVKSLFAPIVPHNMQGIGDDCAVIYSGNQATVITTDMLCENVHFKLSMGGHAIGMRAVQVNLSDIAAMGAEPTAIFLSIAVPDKVSDEFITDFFAAIRDCGIPLLGGDTTRSAADFIVNITAIGTVPAANIKLRNGAKVGDTVFVTGELGAQSLSGYTADVVAQTKQGIWLGGRPEVNSMMDISDGIAGDITHILESSAVGADIDLGKIPIAAGASIEHALCGGEDFLLLFTCDPAMAKELKDDYFAAFAAPLYDLGVITPNIGGLRWLQNSTPAAITPQGFRHF